MASLGNIVRPCSAHTTTTTTTTENLKAEKKKSLLHINQEIIIFFLPRQDEHFSFKVSNFKL